MNIYRERDGGKGAGSYEFLLITLVKYSLLTLQKCINLATPKAVLFNHHLR